MNYFKKYQNSILTCSIASLLIYKLSNYNPIDKLRTIYPINFSESESCKKNQVDINSSVFINDTTSYLDNINKIKNIQREEFNERFNNITNILKKQNDNNNIDETNLIRTFNLYLNYKENNVIDTKEFNYLINFITNKKNISYSNLITSEILNYIASE